MKYVPTSFFKTMRNDILKSLFDMNGIVLDGVNWESRVQATDKSVAKAWSDLREKDVNSKAVADIHEAFQCISALGKPCAEITSVLGLMPDYDILKAGDTSLPEDLTAQELAAEVYIRFGRRGLLRVLDASCVRNIPQRKWIEFGNAPQSEIRVTPELKEAIASEIDKAYDGIRGGNCRVETYPMDEGVFYIHGKMDDKPEFIEMKKPDENDYGYEPRIRPYSVTFAYDSERCKISMCGILPRKKMSGLIASVSRIITGQAANLERLEKPTYDLSVFACGSYRFPALPGTGVSRIYLKMIVIRPDCTPDSEVTFRNIGGGSVYESIGAYHQGFQLPEGTFSVLRATVVMEFTEADIKSIQFELTPKSCTQTGLLDAQRKLVNLLIEKMGIGRR